MSSLNFVSNIGKNVVNTIVNLYFEIFIYVTLKELVKLGKFVLSLILLHLVATSIYKVLDQLESFSKPTSFNVKSGIESIVYTYKMMRLFASSARI